MKVSAALALGMKDVPLGVSRNEADVSVPRSEFIGSQMQIARLQQEVEENRASHGKALEDIEMKHRAEIEEIGELFAREQEQQVAAAVAAAMAAYEGAIDQLRPVA